MCNVMVSYFMRKYKVQRNERQSRYEQSNSSRLEQAYWIMIRAIRVEKSIYVASRLEQKELRGVIRLEQIIVKASGEKTLHIEAEQEHHGQREETWQKRRRKRSEKIRAESDKSSAEQVMVDTMPCPTPFPMPHLPTC